MHGTFPLSDPCSASVGYSAHAGDRTKPEQNGTPHIRVLQESEQCVVRCAFSAFLISPPIDRF